MRICTKKCDISFPKKTKCFFDKWNFLCIRIHLGKGRKNCIFLSSNRKRTFVSFYPHQLYWEATCYDNPYWLGSQDGWLLFFRRWFYVPNFSRDNKKPWDVQTTITICNKTATSYWNVHWAMSYEDGKCCVHNIRFRNNLCAV